MIGLLMMSMSYDVWTVQARLAPGRCLNTKRKGIMKILDWPRFGGTWYEVERDRFTFFSWTGVCNRRELTFDSNADKWARANKEGD